MDFLETACGRSSFRANRGSHRQRVVPADCVFLRAMDDAAKLRGLLARRTALGRADARLRVEFRALRDPAFVGELCDDADGVATTPGVRE